MDIHSARPAKMSATAQINSLKRKYVNHKLALTERIRRSHKNTDSRVHPTLPLMGSCPHSGQTPLLFLQRMNPTKDHSATPLNRNVANNGSQIQAMYCLR